MQESEFQRPPPDETGLCSALSLRRSSPLVGVGVRSSSWGRGSSGDRLSGRHFGGVTRARASLPDDARSHHHGPCRVIDFLGYTPGLKTSGISSPGGTGENKLATFEGRCRLSPRFGRTSGTDRPSMCAACTDASTERWEGRRTCFALPSCWPLDSETAKARGLPPSLALRWVSKSRVCPPLGGLALLFEL